MVNVGIFKLIFDMPTVETESNYHQKVEAEAHKGDCSPSGEIFITLLLLTIFHIGVLISETCLLVVMPYPVDDWSSNNSTNNHSSIKQTKSLGSGILKAEPLDSEHQDWVNDTYS